MGINIGNGNKIIKSIIAEHNEGSNPIPPKHFFSRHPWICTFIVSFVVGLVLLFSFWKDIINWIEGIV